MEIYHICKVWKLSSSKVWPLLPNETGTNEFLKKCQDSHFKRQVWRQTCTILKVQLYTLEQLSKKLKILILGLWSLHFEGQQWPHVWLIWKMCGQKKLLPKNHETSANAVVAPGSLNKHVLSYSKYTGPPMPYSSSKQISARRHLKGQSCKGEKFWSLEAPK